MATSISLNKEYAEKLEKIKDEMMVDPSNAEVVRTAIDKMENEVVNK